MKWYEEKDAENDVIVASRIRLLRNLRDYKFPWKLEEEDAKRLTKELEEKLCGFLVKWKKLPDMGSFINDADEKKCPS